MFSVSSLLALATTSVHLAIASQGSSFPLPVHNISRQPGYHFENLAVRPNGQILATTAGPRAEIYQVDPLGILPSTLVYQIPLVNGSAAGINERAKDVYYVVAGVYDLLDHSVTHPDSYQIVELDMRGMYTNSVGQSHAAEQNYHQMLILCEPGLYVHPNGTLNRPPPTRRVANLTGAQLPNGATFARPDSNNLLVADSYRGLIWNVDVLSGDVSITLNDTSTKGGAPTGPSFTGINGIKEHNG